MGVRVTLGLDTINTIIINNGNFVQEYPAVAFNGTNYVAIWSDDRLSSGSVDYVMAARITPAGVVLDPTGNCIGAQVDTIDEWYPDIAADGARCLAVWYNYDCSPRGVFGRFVNAAGQPEGGLILISATVATSMANPSIGFDGTNYFVVWGDNSVIYGQFVSPTGALVGSKITIAPSGTYPEVVFDGYSYLVVWRFGTSAVYGQRVATSGALVGSSFRISDNTADWKLQIAAGAGISNYLVVWAERHVDYDIFGNVDVSVIGIVENRTAAFGKTWNATILGGPLQLPKGRTCRIFDITGRVVMPEAMKPGIYFIEIEGKILQKVIEVR